MDNNDKKMAAGGGVPEKIGMEELEKVSGGKKEGCKHEWISVFDGNVETLTCMYCGESKKVYH